MSAAEVSVSTRLCSEVCCTCGMTFAMPEIIQQHRRKDHQGFFCPAGHQQFYLHETNEEKLKKQVAQLEADKQNLTKRREWAEQSAKVASADAEKAKKSLKTLRGRAKAGVCPCCKRTVKQMAAHMASKHPDFKP